MADIKVDPYKPDQPKLELDKKLNEAVAAYETATGKQVHEVRWVEGGMVWVITKVRI